ncbi:ATP-grasp domain-containing protein [Wansuia hejianensis]|uniref:ATP-grasp domain-containing protein n=1 Tax=Wansuia hejianensis TaxID=2763667 RepID=A0A926F1A6_9FIRM|nr:ATP-grasp domain-containing protein [Wansuia hejianensis]
MKNIMILGANTLQIPLIQEAQRIGFNTVVVSPNKEEPGFKYATYPIYADVKDQELLLKYAREYDIAGVITDQTDIPVRTAAYIAENMGLPGIGYETATLFTDKFLMREKCKELNIPTLKYKLVKNIEEAIEFFDALEGDAILKPVDNQGSKGVSKINSKEVLIEKFQEAMDYSKSQSVLIEQYVTGREFVVEGLTYDYEFQNLICGDTHYFNIPDVFSATTRIFPSTADKDLVERVKDLNRKIVTGFGLKQGISHSEFIMDGDEIYLIETAARGGGVFISSDLISLSTGLNTEKFLIEMATGTLKEVPEIKDTGKVCCYMAFFLPVGEVVSIEGVHKVKELSYTHRDNLDTIYMGLKTKPFVDKTARKFIIVSGDSHDELIENMKAIKDALQIKVKTDQGIEGPIWN